MRFWDVLAVVTLIVLAVLGKGFGERGFDGIVDPRRPDPRQFVPSPPTPRPPERDGIALPPESRLDPIIRIEAKERAKSSRGTAFSIDGSGVWITARHVTDGCDRIVLGTRGRFVRVSRVRQQISSDISILWTRRGSPPMPVVEPTLRAGQNGYSFGYPKGEPGDVHGQIIGRSRIRHIGHRNTIEPAIAWTQVRRVPDRGTDLRGISGGPWIDDSGQVIGVHVAGAPRRGRSYSTASRTLIAAIRDAGLKVPRGARIPAEFRPTTENFSGIGDLLRQRLSVAQVVCLVGERWRTTQENRGN
jgi:hypothetical protein